VSDYAALVAEQRDRQERRHRGLPADVGELAGLLHERDVVVLDVDQDGARLALGVDAVAVDIEHRLGRSLRTSATISMSSIRRFQVLSLMPR
jgi:hypothetical protein